MPRTSSWRRALPYESSWLWQTWWLLLLLGFRVVERVSGSSALYSFEVTHRYSDKARHELKARHSDAFLDWPQQGTQEFHTMLFYLDLHRHFGHIFPHITKSKAKAAPLMASSVGNATYFNRHDGQESNSSFTLLSWVTLFAELCHKPTFSKQRGVWQNPTWVVERFSCHLPLPIWNCALFSHWSWSQSLFLCAQMQLG